MRVLFVASGNHEGISPVVKVQGDSLEKAGVELDYFLVKGKGVMGYIRQIRPLRRYCKQHNFDVVHAHYSFSAYVASLARVKPLVVSLMGSDSEASSKKKKMISLFSKIFHWPVVLVKSKKMAEGLSVGCPVQVIPNGVDTTLLVPMDKDACREHLNWKSGVKHILFPANPDRQEKDFDLATKAVEKLGPEVEMHVFKGVEHSETVYHYNASDVVLLTSKWEGSPNVIKEALACGCPIVSTNVGDVSERMEGVDGCIVAQTRNPEELSDLLSKALAFEGKTKGREKIINDNLDNRQVVQRLIDLYKSVC